MELETHILIAGRLTYLNKQEVEEVLKLTGEVGRMLNALIQVLKQKQK